jgi:hypothetical protein
MSGCVNGRVIGRVERVRRRRRLRVLNGVAAAPLGQVGKQMLFTLGSPVEGRFVAQLPGQVLEAHIALASPGALLEKLGVLQRRGRASLR